MSESNIQTGGRKGIPVLGNDGRIAYDGPAVAERVKSQGEKDTRRWCKGRVGIEHQPVWQFWFEIYRHQKPQEYQVRKCLECGRHCGLRVIRSDIPPSRQ